MKHTILVFGGLFLMDLSRQVSAYDEDGLKEILETNDCQKCHLSGVNLKMENLAGQM
jgi:hypothetical protein